MVERAELNAFEQGWLQVLDQLHSCPETKVLHEIVGELDELADESSFDDLADWEGVELGPAYRADFLRFTRFGCLWQTLDQEDYLAGEFRLTPLPNAVHEDAPSHFSASFWSDEDRAVGKQLRIIDEHPFTGTGHYVALRLEPGVQDPELWLEDQEGLWRLDLDYRQYLDALRLTKGAFGWQHLFTSAPLDADYYESTVYQLRAMRDVLPELFPDHDYSGLRDRLQDRL